MLIVWSFTKIVYFSKESKNSNASVAQYSIALLQYIYIFILFVVGVLSLLTPSEIKLHMNKRFCSICIENA
jgi:hypothetical protein